MQLKNVKIINHNETIENANITLENGVITSVEKIEGTGSTIVVPGFIDTHIHGFMGNDFMDSAEAVKTISNELSKVGTTSFFATVMTASSENISKSLSEVASVAKTDSKIKGIHLEGPFVSVSKKGAHDENFIVKPTVELLNKYQDDANKLIRKITFAPEVSTNEIVKEMIALGMSPTIGHTNGNYDEIEQAIKSGANSCTHLWNAMSGVSNRNPGAVEAILNSDNVYAELITDLIHVDKEAIKLSIKAKGIEKIVVITDSIRPSGLPDGESISGGFAVDKVGNKITIKGTDTIAGSGATMHSNFVVLAGLGYNLNDIVAMTSYNATQNTPIGKVGIIKEGFAADLVVMNNDYSLNEVYVAGNKVN